MVSCRRRVVPDAARAGRSGGAALGRARREAAGGAPVPRTIPPRPSAVTHAARFPGPPDPTQIDSWLQVNPDNTVTLFPGWAELGQGTPTAVRMIAAEELGLSMDAGVARRRSTRTCRSRRSRSGATRPRPRWARRACAAPRPPRGRCSLKHGVGAARRAGRRACRSRTASSRGGGKTRHATRSSRPGSCSTARSPPRRRR